MRIATIALVLVLSAVLLFFSGSVFKSKEDYFPEKLNTRVELKESGDAIQVRFIQVSDDGDKLVMIRTDFRNGATVFDYFRDDGTLREEAEYFPGDEDAVSDEITDRQVRKVTLYLPDGKTKETVNTYRQDGTSAEHTRLRVDGTFEIESYSENGTRIVQRAVRTKTGKLLTREVYDMHGVLETVVRVKNSDTRIVQFRSDGITPRTLTIRKPYRGYTYSYGGYYNPKPEYYEFHKDGVTIALKVTYRSNGKNVQYFSVNGVLQEERDYADFGRFIVTGYYDNGQKRFEQNWTGPPWKAFDLDQMTLLRGKEYDRDGRQTYAVEFHPNKNPRTVRFWDGKGRHSGYERTFNEDGILVKEVPILDLRSYGEEKVYGEGDEKIKADLPRYLYKIESRDEAPDESELPSAGL